MKISIDGTYVNKNICTATPFKFGKAVNELPHTLCHRYRMSFSIRFLRDKFENIFDHFIEEYKEDDRLYPGQEDNLLLRKKGYPTLQQLLDEDVAFLAQFIIEHLGLELMDSILAEKGPKLEYVICSIEEIMINNSLVNIVGKCIKYEESDK